MSCVMTESIFLGPKHEIVFLVHVYANFQYSATDTFTIVLFSFGMLLGFYLNVQEVECNANIILQSTKECHLSNLISTT